MLVGRGLLVKQFKCCLADDLTSLIHTYLVKFRPLSKNCELFKTLELLKDQNNYGFKTTKFGREMLSLNFF